MLSLEEILAEGVPAQVRVVMMIMITKLIIMITRTMMMITKMNNFAGAAREGRNDDYHDDPNDDHHDHNDHDDPNDDRNRTMMINFFAGASREGGAKQGKPLQRVPVLHSHHHKT